MLVDELFVVNQPAPLFDWDPQSRRWDGHRRWNDLRPGRPIRPLPFSAAWNDQSFVQGRDLTNDHRQNQPSCECSCGQRLQLGLKPLTEFRVVVVRQLVNDWSTVGSIHQRFVWIEMTVKLLLNCSPLQWTLWWIKHGFLIAYRPTLTRPVQLLRPCSVCYAPSNLVMEIRARITPINKR